MNDDDDDIDITITAEKFRLHYGEKVSTGEYENAQVNATIEGSIDGAEIDDDLPYDVRARLLRASKSLQKDVEQAAENRKKMPAHEEWSPDGG